MSEFQKVKNELVKLRNGKTESCVIARPYKNHKDNLIWFMSLTSEKTTNMKMAKVLGLRPDSVKNAMRKILKSSHALKYIKKTKQNNRNIYINSIPKNIDIKQFVKKVNKTIDMSIKESKITFVERLTDLGIKLPCTHGFHCNVYFLQNAGNRGLTQDEFLESYGVTKENEKLDPGLTEHGKSFITSDFRNWNDSYLKNMYSTRMVYDKKYYFLKQGFDLDPYLFSIIAKGTFGQQLKMDGKTISRTTQVHDKKTSNSIKRYNNVSL